MSTPLQIAESYVGFRSRALRTNDFGYKAGHGLEIWAGSFLHVVFQEAGYENLPHFSHTASALRFAELFGLVVRTPQAGDIAFLSFPTDLTGMAQAHVGIVADVQNWKASGTVQLIEGETAPNAARRHLGATDGVWKRTRYDVEITHFARFELLKTPKLRRNAPVIDEKDITYLKKSEAVPHIQLALADVFGNQIRGVRKGVWDAGTAHAYGEWERLMGIEASGLPEHESLDRLGRLTGRFVAA